MFPTNKARPRRVGLTRRPLSASTTAKSLASTSNSTRPTANGLQPLLGSTPRQPLHTFNTKPSTGISKIGTDPAAKTEVRCTEGFPSALKETIYFSVLYTKRSKKKHKSWLDGYVILKNDRHVQLQNEDGKTVASERFSKALGGLKDGNTLEIRSWELEVQNEVQEDAYISGRLFAPPPPVNTVVQRKKQKPFKPLTNHANVTHSNTDNRALHDPCATDAVVLLGSIKHGDTTTVAVVLDPFLAKRMRPHQLQGIRFLFDCTAGRRVQTGEGGEGAILADEMGLGKSLQAIALIWTLIKQGPFGKPLAKKAIIVCPASLVKNWVNEIRKWLGDERLKPVALESGVSTFESKQAMASFISGSVRKLLVISYEMFRSNATELCNSQCALMVCDEGHRLKSAGGNKTIDALRKVPCRRRVILSGTPIQNDLEEFFAVCDFVNPGCLNSLSSFRTVFANPILASRDSNAARSVAQLGEARAKELFRVTSKFVLRRTSSILEKYLPAKHETVVFCRLEEQQENDYQLEAQRRYVDVMDNRWGRGWSGALCAINFLRKICSHPCLMNKEDEDGNEEGDTRTRVAKEEFHEKDSAKMQVTGSICEASVQVHDKVILVSNFTSVLDLLEKMMKKKNISFCRLDGSTPVGHRGDIVRRFNEGHAGDVFLLSAKAGGVGLNLIGANRLILFDPDWNPATDVQAMARVWRDGQKKDVFIYRLICTGTIEEKILQRQLFKGELQSAVDGSDGNDEDAMIGGKDGNFKTEELKDVFQYKGDVQYCETLDVLERSKDDECKVGLLQRFREYKILAEKEQVEKMVWCGEDDVLDRALNGQVKTHGIVSYLYVKKYGEVKRDVGEAQLKVSTMTKKRKFVSIISDSDSACGSESDSDIDHLVSTEQRSPLIQEVYDEELESTNQAGKMTWDDALKHLED